MSTIQGLDNRILGAIQSKTHCTTLDKAMPYITRLGNKGIIWVIVAALFFAEPSYRRTAAILMLALALSGGIACLGIKPQIRRARPCDVNPEYPLLIPRPTDTSFPSGHTMSSVAAAVVIFWAVPVFAPGAFLLAALIAFSRLYLHVHYPSDVLVGGILGVFAARLAIMLLSMH